MSETRSFSGGAITGLAVEGDTGDGPLIIIIPGGGSKASDFDIIGRSFLSLCAANGYSAIALNRPAQADSRPLPLDPAADVGAFRANAEELLVAIDSIWDQLSTKHAGIVIYGCSIGGAITLHMASIWSEAPRRWPLLGITVADIGQVPPGKVVGTWRSLPMEDKINLAPYIPRLGQPPVWTMRPPLTDSGAPLVPRAELQEVVGGWPRDWESVVSTIAVPAQYILAEHDMLWIVADEHVAQFGMALSTKAPYVDARIMQGAAHSLTHGTLGKSHMLEALAFVERCSVFGRYPEMLSPKAGEQGNPHFGGARSGHTEIGGHDPCKG